MGGMPMPAGIEPEKWDVFHNLVVNDELSRYVRKSLSILESIAFISRFTDLCIRVGFSGILWGMNGGNGIGCPPILNFGNEQQKLEYLPKIARGEIRFCLGITEPDGLC